MIKKKLHFVCNKNKRRSLTAEKMFKDNTDYVVKSAGIEKGSRVRITEGMIGWADVIFVMESKHRSRLKEHFREAIEGKQLNMLNIPDNYMFIQTELILVLEKHLLTYLIL
jgi:predicted protein tyrosine phosphatase